MIEVIYIKMSQEQTDSEEQHDDVSEVSITFDVFETFFSKHPDLDNAEYYKHFPTVNTGTIRSWKSRAKNSMEPATPSQQATPPKQDNKDQPSSDTYLDELIKTLMATTRISPKLLEGLDPKSQLAVLRNYQAERKADPNLKLFTPMGTSQKKLGIEQFVRIDERSFREKGFGRIEVEIPASIAFDPEKSKKLREYN